MAEAKTYQLLADLVLTLHLAIVLFVVGGLLLVVIGNLRGWSWVNALWFRLAHLATILVVVLESWAGIVCPLTTLEMWLRRQARQEGYAGGFIEYWLQSLLYFSAPPWVFTLVYTLFALLVALSWWYFPPSFARRSRKVS